MSTDCVVLVGAGPLPELQMRRSAEALATGGKRALISHAAGESPHDVLRNVANQHVILRLSGDAARWHPQAGSWLEALADWNCPVLFLVGGDADGGIPGTAASYIALSQKLRVPLIGIAQVDGAWDTTARRQDQLPWCGWIPAANHPRHDDGRTALADVIRSGRLTASSARAAKPGQA
ncbi:hypothetical protein [Synechococcus sp. MIT S1220]|uniref:hypothetical protein n=1 Tax=Synechococcus sp. MIT S1220 TaxID=3082549 RepID=UPI0039B0A56C